MNYNLKTNINKLINYTPLKKLINYINNFFIDNKIIINTKSNNKKVVYTCITNGYDNLPIHSYIDTNWDYICFTDDTSLIEQKIYGNWTIRPIIFNELDNTRNNRWHKLHPHIILNNYEESIYIDANINVLNDYLFTCIEKLNYNISISKHPERICIYEEAKAVSYFKKDNDEIIKKQINIYKKENFPEDLGLTDNSCIYRKHNDKEIISIMEDWWYWVKNYSKRDQLSLFYVLWKHNKKMKYLTEIPIRKDPSNFQYFDHKNNNIELQ